MDTFRKNVVAAAAGASENSLVFRMKGEAAAVQVAAKANGDSVTRAAALELVARRHGYKDWNAASVAAQAADQARISTSTISTRDTVAPQFFWEDIGTPLPQRPLHLMQAGEVFGTNLLLFDRWAQQLQFIAEKVAPEHRRAAMDLLIDDDRPYVFVADPESRRDIRFRLCNRGYDPFGGCSLTLSGLERIGVIAWNDRHGSHTGGDMLSIVSDELINRASPVELKMCARLIYSVCTEMRRHSGHSGSWTQGMGAS